MEVYYFEVLGSADSFVGFCKYVAHPNIIPDGSDVVNVFYTIDLFLMIPIFASKFKTHHHNFHFEFYFEENGYD